MTYLKGKILDEGVVKINCPAANCAAQLKYEEIKLFSPRKVFVRYVSFFLSTLI
jgi:hypothetical protein